MRPLSCVSRASLGALLLACCGQLAAASTHPAAHAAPAVHAASTGGGPPVARVAIVPAVDSATRGDTLTLSASAIAAGSGKPITGAAVTWGVNAPLVAKLVTLSTTGRARVILLDTGTVAIDATSRGVTGRVVLRVRARPPAGPAPVDTAQAVVLVADTVPGLLQHTASSRCLDVAYVQRTPGGQVILYDCVPTAPDETWRLPALGGVAPVTIYGGALCLAPAGGDTVTTATCSGAAVQTWRRDSAQLVHVASGRCLAPAGSGTANLTRITLAVCNSGNIASVWTKAAARDPAAGSYDPTAAVVAPATPEVLRTTAATPATIALAVQRFDSGTGPALVTTGIPLQAGALFPGQEPQAHVRVDGAERPLYAAALASRYPDGSIRSLLVQFRVASLGATEQRAAQLVLGGGSRSGSTLLSAPLARPGSDSARGTAPLGLPQAAALPTSVTYLLATDLVGPTISRDSARSLGGAFARYESAFDQFAEQHWTNVGPAWNDGDYYDRALVYDAAWVRSARPVYWARAQRQAADYRDGYLVPINYGSSPHWAQLEGLEKHYLLTGDEASRVAVVMVADRLTHMLPEYYDQRSGEAREMGRFLLSALYAWRLSPPGVPLAAHPVETGWAPVTDWNAYLAWITGRALAWQTPDGRWPSDGICNGQLNYMVGILNTALIKVYEQWRPDPRFVDAVRRSADYLMATQWRPEANAFQYANVSCTTGSPDPAADLGGFFVDAFGWLYRRTGDARYRTFGEQAFAGSVTGAYLWGSKQFNQQYHTSYRYLGYR